MKSRTYTNEQCNSRIEELEEIISACDEAIGLMDQVIDLTFSTGNATEARGAMLRVRGDAQEAIRFWASRRPLL